MQAEHLLDIHTGEGEFGVVHKAIWYGTVVAAKILKNTSDIALGDFRAEIEVLRKVCPSAHPVHLTNVFGVKNQAVEHAQTAEMRSASAPCEAMVVQGHRP